MYRVEFYCPRQAPYWQTLPETFWIQGSAVSKANSLVWQYHSARVVDRSGNVIYQI